MQNLSMNTTIEYRARKLLSSMYRSTTICNARSRKYYSVPSSRRKDFASCNALGC